MINRMRFDIAGAGFTLIEILIALIIVSVALMSLGSFAISIIDSGQQSRERLSAVHLAEQVLEFWQHDKKDFAPSIDSNCVLVSGTSTSASATCTPTTGVSMTYTVVASSTWAKGPLPSNLSKFQRFESKGLTLKPMTKVVTVSWSHKGAARSVFLTHLTVVQ